MSKISSASNRRIAAVLAGIVLAAVVFVPVPGSGEWRKVLQDFGHAPAFGCVALVTLLWVRDTRLSASAQYLIAWATAFALGLATEGVQFFVARDPSWMDVRSDAIGATAFLGIVAAFDPRYRRSTRAVCVLIAGAVAVVQVLPVVTMLRAYEHRSALLPTLASFTEPRDLYFVRSQSTSIAIVPLPAAFATHPGESALHVSFASGAWPGVSVIEPAPDWRGFSTLAVEMVNPTHEPLAMTFRAHDASHNNELTDRLNRVFHVPALTRATLRIAIADIEAAPQGRSMDLRRMANFTLFRSRGSTASDMYLVSVRLER